MQRPADAAATTRAHAVSTRTTTLQGVVGADNNGRTDGDTTTTPTITGRPLLKPIIRALLATHDDDNETHNINDAGAAPILLVDKITVTTSRSSATGEAREAFRLWLSDGVMSVQSLFKADALDLLVLSSSSPLFSGDEDPDASEPAGVCEGSYIALGQFEVLRRPRLTGQGFVWVILVSSLHCIGHDGRARGGPDAEGQVDHQKPLPQTVPNSPEKLLQQGADVPKDGIDNVPKEGTDNVPTLPRLPGEPSDSVLKFNNDLIPVMRDPDTESVDLVPSPAKSISITAPTTTTTVGTPPPRQHKEPSSKTSDQSTTTTSSGSGKRKASDISGSQPLLPLDANAKRTRTSAEGRTETDSGAGSRPGTGGSSRPTTSVEQDSKTEGSREGRFWRRPGTRDEQPEMSAQEMLQVQSAKFYNKMKALQDAAAAAAAARDDPSEKVPEASHDHPAQLSRTDTNATTTTASPAKHDYSPAKGSPLSTMTSSQQKRQQQLRQTQLQMTPSKAGKAQMTLKSTPGKSIFKLSPSTPKYDNSPPPDHQPEEEEEHQHHHLASPSPKSRFLPATKSARVTKPSPSKRITTTTTTSTTTNRRRNNNDNTSGNRRPLHLSRSNSHTTSNSNFNSGSIPPTRVAHVSASSSTSSSAPTAPPTIPTAPAPAPAPAHLPTPTPHSPAKPKPKPKPILRPLNLVPLSSLTGTKATRGAIVDILVLISHVNPRVLVRRGFPDSRELLVMDTSTRRQVHLTVFVDAASFTPPVGSVAVMRNITTHEYGGGSLKAYFGRCSGVRWFLPEPEPQTGAVRKMGMDGWREDDDGQGGGGGGGGEGASAGTGTGTGTSTNNSRSEHGTGTGEWEFHAEADALRRHWLDTPEARTVPEKAWWTERGVAKMMREQGSQQGQQGHQQRQ